MAVGEEDAAEPARVALARDVAVLAVGPDDPAVGAEEHLVRVSRHERDRVLVGMLRLAGRLGVTGLVGPVHARVGREQDRTAFGTLAARSGVRRQLVVVHQAREHDHVRPARG